MLNNKIIWKAYLKQYLNHRRLNIVDENLLDSLLGVVLIFNRNVSYNKIAKRFNSISIILFLYFRTGRIERYLINKNFSDFEYKTLDDAEDLFITLDDEKYKIFHKPEYDINTDTVPEMAYFNKDGKITSKLFYSFMGALLKDNLFTSNSYLNPNINI